MSVHDPHHEVCKLFSAALSTLYPRNVLIFSRNVTSNLTEIKRIVRECYEQLYAEKWDDVDETNKFLERHELSKVVPEEIENCNRPITSKEIKLGI